MKLVDISPQWEAKGGKLRPVNKYDVPYRDVWPHYRDYEKYCLQHVFDTNAPDGIYKVEELNEPVWQLKRIHGSFWSTSDEQHKSHFKDYEDYLKTGESQGFKTRQYVTLKEQQ